MPGESPTAYLQFRVTAVGLHGQQDFKSMLTSTCNSHHPVVAVLLQCCTLIMCCHCVLCKLYVYYVNMFFHLQNQSSNTYLVKMITVECASSSVVTLLPWQRRCHGNTAVVATPLLAWLHNCIASSNDELMLLKEYC